MPEMKTDTQPQQSVPPEISLILPVRNEAESLEELHAKIVEVMLTQSAPYEMLFVDDGSSDNSFEVLGQLSRRDKRIRVIQFRRNFGKAAAYNAGFTHARGEILVTMDTDLQDDPAEIPLFLAKIEAGFDMVVGWKSQGKGSPGKTIPSKVFNRIVSTITGIKLHDFNCPFKAYRKTVLSEIDLYGELHRYIPVLASSRGFSIAEITISNHPRLHGVSKYGVERFIRGMLDLLTVIFITRFAPRPLHLLGLIGLAVCSLGGIILAFLGAAHLLYVTGVLQDSSWNLHDRPIMTLGVLLAIVGIQFFSIGLVGEMLVKMRLSDSPESGYSIKRRLGVDERSQE